MTEHLGRSHRLHTRRDLLRLSARTAGVVVLAGTFPVALAACGDDPESGDSGLNPEDIESASGTVKVLSWPWYETPAQVPTGITAEWGYLAANEDTITKTQQAGSFDVVGIYQGQIDQLRALDRIDPIDVSLLTNWGELNPLFQNTDVVRRDGEVFGIPLVWGYAYTVYDKRQVAEPLTFDDLKAPELAGKVAVPDDPYAVITTFAKHAGFTDNPNQLTPEQFDQVMQVMQDFKTQLRTVYQYGEAAQLLGRQDIAVAFPEFGPTFVDAQAGGADADWTLLNAWSFVDSFMVLSGSENKAASYAFIDRSISPEGQRAIAEVSFTFPVVDSAVAGLPEPLQYDSPDDILADAPLLPGPPFDDSEGYVPFPDWVSAFDSFKSA